LWRRLLLLSLLLSLLLRWIGWRSGLLLRTWFGLRHTHVDVATNESSGALRNVTNARIA
jgi:hypothetical protein